MARHKGADWNLNAPVKAWEECIVAVLMDIRDELKEINFNLKHGRYEQREAEISIRRIDKRLQKRIKLK